MLKNFVSCAASHSSKLFQEPAAMLQLRQQGGKLSGPGQPWQPNPRLDARKPRPNDLVLLHMPALPDRDQYMPGLSPSSTATITIRSQGGNKGTAMSLGGRCKIRKIKNETCFIWGVGEFGQQKKNCSFRFFLVSKKK